MGNGITTAEALEMKRALERSLAKRGASSARYIKKKKLTRFNALIVASRPGLVGVLELLPAALKLNRSGYKVHIRCEEWLHDIFECVDYCEPEIGTHVFDKIFDTSRAWMTATTAEKKAWRLYLYERFKKDFGYFNTLEFSRLPNPRLGDGEFCFVWNEAAYKNVGFSLRHLPWLIAHAKSLEFAEPKGSDVCALIVAATRNVK